MSSVQTTVGETQEREIPTRDREAEGECTVRTQVRTIGRRYAKRCVHNGAIGRSVVSNTASIFRATPGPVIDGSFLHRTSSCTVPNRIALRREKSRVGASNGNKKPNGLIRTIGGDSERTTALDVSRRLVTPPSLRFERCSVPAVARDAHPKSHSQLRQR